jgi:hypothetical protein
MSDDTVRCPECGLEIERTLSGKSTAAIHVAVRQFQQACARQDELGPEARFGSLVNPYACPTLKVALRP